MKNGQVKFWWRSEGREGTKIIEKECDTVLDALWLLQCHAILEVNDANVSFNINSISYYHEEYLKEEYDCEDGFVDIYTLDGDEIINILDDTYDKYSEECKWFCITKEQIKQYIIESDIKPEHESVKMY